MKTVILAAALLALAVPAALAQKPANPEGQTPPVATPKSKNPDAPVAGKNSFTEGQARSRIEAAGYTKVTGLKLDDKGVWRGRATRNGKQVNVSMDYQGNVTPN